MLFTLLCVILLSTLLGCAICAGGIQLMLRFMGRPAAQTTSTTQAQ